MIRRAAPRGAGPTYADTRTVSQEPLQGVCEAQPCRGRARGACPDCEGEYCLKHLEHDEHAKTS